MKKILFATTALVATAGIASAQGVEVSGSAEVGIVGGERYDSATNDAVDQLWTDVEVTFTMSGEADNGLTFGGSVQLDEAQNANGTDDGGATWFLAFGGARLDMGDTDGAFDAALTEVALVGTMDDTETAYFGYSGNSGLDGSYDGQVARFSYSFDAFTGYLSTEIDDSGEYDPVWGIGASYAGNFAGFNLGFGIGHQQGDEDYSDDTVVTSAAAVLSAIRGADGILGTADDGTAEQAFGSASGIAESITGVSLSATSDAGIQVVLNYSEAEYSDDTVDTETESHSAIGLGYTMNALSLGLSYSQYENRFGIDNVDAQGYALSANYDLGGGLVAQAGYSAGEVDFDGDDFDSDSYSLGLAMSF